MKGAAFVRNLFLLLAGAVATMALGGFAADRSVAAFVILVFLSPAMVAEVWRYVSEPTATQREGAD